jgi:hypothetical protein
MVLEQFDDTLVKILLLAAGVSFGLAFMEGGGRRAGDRGVRGAGCDPADSGSECDCWRVAGVECGECAWRR